MATRFGEDTTTRIPVKNITFPDLTFVTQLGRRDNFSLFVPRHQKMAERLIIIFMGNNATSMLMLIKTLFPEHIVGDPMLLLPGMRTFEDFMAVAVYARERVNPYLYVYALSVAILHRPDAKGIQLPPLSEMFPEKYVDGSLFSRAREEANILNEQQRLPLEIPMDYTATDLEPEHRVAYFREDLGINLHHWHWHLVYPTQGPTEIDINRDVDQLRVDLSDIERWRDRIVEAVQVGRVVDNSGKDIELTETGGIDVLGNMIEASALSPNYNLYGDLHNFGHVVIALAHDPDHRHLETFSVMGDTATAMRDPAFYRWHATIDDIFQMHKRTLPRYTASQLDYQGIRVTSVEVDTQNAPKNTFLTFWQQYDIDLSRGMDFAPRGSIFARVTQLQHSPFSYKIQVENNSKESRIGTVRIFLAPKFDERGQPMLFNDQRILMVEMDKFQVTIKNNPKASTISRDSTKSSITIPFERTFRDLEARPAGQVDADAFNYCGCGWPEHMLVPKGTGDGFPCQLFVMVSNIADDRVDGSAPGQGTCAESSSFCGIRDKKYPDKRSMGFPFDRVARTGVDTLQQFLTPNMAVIDVNIKFSSKVEPPKKSVAMVSMEQKMLMQSQILCLLERPGEPIFVPKGSQRAVFDVPNSEYMTDKYRPLMNDLASRFKDATLHMPIKEIVMPNISQPLRLARNDNFSLFIANHQKMAAKLIDVFLNMPTYEDFLAACVFCRDRMNCDLFVYAVSVAVLHRPDTKGIHIPPLSEILPRKFIPASAFSMVQEALAIQPDGLRDTIVIPQNSTGSNLDPEHRLAYFREDIGLNLHHWHWHMVYPYEGPRVIVDKDRRGELFYYMHKQVMARYNIERFCNQLGRTRKLQVREPLDEGYFPKLTNINTNREWPGRRSRARLMDVDKEQFGLHLDIESLERWTDRIIEAINVGSVIDAQGRAIPLDEVRGIDILGNIIEASIISINPNLYGDIHNGYHDVISFAHDPDNKHMEGFGVLGDPSTAMRDPAFYRLHAYIDQIFQMHKSSLPWYTSAQLGFPGIRITSVEVATEVGRKNELDTFWQQIDLDVSRGMDFSPWGPCFVRVTRLQHTPFRYRIQVENNSNTTLAGTVRIFLAPKFNELGEQMPLNDQRHFFIELDKFSIRFRSNPRVSLIERDSSSSSVTIPFARTFSELEANPAGPPELQPFNYCGCGWPDNLLIPKGTAEGYPCELFVMISNMEDDKIDQPNPITGSDADSSSYCGLRDMKYPDRRSMGFPFDRVCRNTTMQLKDFLTPNMAVADVRIFFNNHIEPPKDRALNMTSS
ncbi:hypothetical protein J437_LFUL018540 [Ladona fulva]|uniref:Tyrosinase copper-binding domain-containing protein n=1 Tax=Ladona fulva TaxID=123851 RepID=A0A8K0KP11_LADFU|nr:hypothetical protein J437_LFUL018540 [Ladona fulva]